MQLFNSWHFLAGVL